VPRAATLVPNLLDTARTLCEGVSMGGTGRCLGSREGRPTSDSQPRGGTPWAFGLGTWGVQLGRPRADRPDIAQIETHPQEPVGARVAPGGGA